MEAIVALATNASLIGDVYAGGDSGRDNDDDEVATNNNPSNNKKRRIKCIPLLFFLIDMIDITLDIIFSFQLYLRSKPIYGSVMLGTTMISIATWWWSRNVVLKYANANHFDTRTIRRVIVFFEMAMFFIQDGTTILIFLSVDESYEVGSLGLFNLAITIICGFAVIVSDLCLSCNLCRCCSSCFGCKDILLGIFNIFCFLWNLVYVLGFMILALLVIIAGGHVDDLNINETNLWTRIWTITSGLWILVLLLNFITLQSFKNKITEDQLSNLGYRLLVFTLIPCCLNTKQTNKNTTKDLEADTEWNEGDIPF